MHPFVSPIRAKRIPGLDLLRLLAVIAVVGIHALHTDPALRTLSRNLSYAVPCFVLMAIYLSCNVIDKGKPCVVFLTGRIARLVPAFFAWSLIYVAARGLDGNIHRIGFSQIGGYLFFGAAALHLYFIPLILYYSLGSILLPGGVFGRVAVCLLALIASICLQFGKIPAVRLGSAEADAFFFYFVYNLPYLFVGVLLFDLVERSFLSEPLHRYSWAAAILCGVGAIAAWYFPPADPKFATLQRIVRDSMLFLTFRFSDFKVPAWALALSGVTFGIYFVHHLLIEGLLRMEGAFGFVSSSYSVTLTRYIVGAGLSAAVCLWLSRNRLTAWLVR